MIRNASEGTTTVRVGVGRQAPPDGEVREHIDWTARLVRKAKDGGSRLLVLPELAIGGLPRDEGLHAQALGLDGEPMDRLKKLSWETPLAFGLLEETDDADCHDAAVFLSRGELRHVQRRVYPPAHGRAIERRLLDTGTDVAAFDTRFGRMAMLAGTDLWHPALPYLAAQSGAVALLAHVAIDPHELGHALPAVEAWHWLARTTALSHGCFVVLSDRNGGSVVVGPDGSLLPAASESDEELLVADLDMASLRAARLALPFRRDDRLELTVSIGSRILEARSRPDGDVSTRQLVPPGRLDGGDSARHRASPPATGAPGSADRVRW